VTVMVETLAVIELDSSVSNAPVSIKLISLNGLRFSLKSEATLESEEGEDFDVAGIQATVLSRMMMLIIFFMRFSSAVFESSVDK